MTKLVVNRIAVPVAFAITLSAAEPFAQAQTRWSPVTSWQGVYSISGSGSGLNPGTGFTWTVKHGGRVFPLCQESSLAAQKRSGSVLT
jgi:hypothetical protein